MERHWRTASKNTSQTATRLGVTGLKSRAEIVQLADSVEVPANNQDYDNAVHKWALERKRSLKRDEIVRQTLPMNPSIWREKETPTGVNFLDGSAEYSPWVIKSSRKQQAV